MRLPDMDQRRMPLLEALVAHAAAGRTPLHVPGHKQGRGAPGRLLELLGPGTFALDLTEVGDLDDLHCPRGVIDEAQRLAAEAFGADETLFLVNGTTAGVQAMVLAACGPHEKIVVPRNAHRSVLSALVLSGAWPVYVMPEVDPATGLALGITADEVARALERHPDVSAILVLYPTYYGAATDLAAIVALARGRRIPVLVDEAHGAHFRFHPELPAAALDLGADLVAQSVHKTLGSLTQSSLLHVRGERIDRPRLRLAASMVQSSSPSYLLLASLDAARCQAATAGRRLLDNTLELAGRARSAINAIPGLACPGDEWTGRPGSLALDRTKLTIDISLEGVTATGAARILAERWGVQVEMAGARHLLLVLTIGDDRTAIDRLLTGLTDLARGHEGRRSQAPAPPELPLPDQVLPPRVAVLGPRERVPLEEAAGRVAAGMIAPSPPGIPVLWPGERINPAIVEYLIHLRDYISTVEVLPR